MNRMRWVRNPEILRHAWLELNPARLISLALILLAVFLLAWLMADSYAGFLKAARTISAVGLVALPGVWGTRLVVDSLTREIRDRTWELQRMTPLSAGEMTLGKLAGGPIFAWCAAPMFALPFLFSAWGREDFSGGIRDLLHLLFAIVFFHGLGLAVTLAGVRKARAWNAEMPRAMPFYLLLALGVFLWIGGTPLSFFARSRLTWYAIPLQTPGFLTGSLVFFAFWAVFGAYRSMRRELRMVGVPWAWLTFLLTCMAYAAGFDAVGSERERFGEFFFVSGGMAQAGAVGLLAAYGVMFAEVKDPVEQRRFLTAVESGDWRSAAESFPLWAMPVILTGVACFGLTAANLGTGFAWFPAVVYLFLLRDMGLILLANRTARPSRADATAVVWLLLLYVLCPLIAGSAGSTEAILFFLAVPYKGGFLQVAAVFCQAAAVAALLVWRGRPGDRDVR